MNLFGKRSKLLESFTLDHDCPSAVLKVLGNLFSSVVDLANQDRAVQVLFGEVSADVNIRPKDRHRPCRQWHWGERVKDSNRPFVQSFCCVWVNTNSK